MIQVAPAPGAAPPAYGDTAAPPYQGAPVHGVPMQPTPVQGLMIQCGQCQKPMQIHPSTPAGSAVACPSCSTTLIVPAQSAAPAAVVIHAQASSAHSGGHSKDYEYNEKRKKKKKNKKDEEYAMYAFIGGFFCCCIWFWGLTFWNSKSDKARMWSKMSLGAILCASCCMFIPIVLSVTATANMTYHTDYGSSCTTSFGGAGCSDSSGLDSDCCAPDGQGYCTSGYSGGQTSTACLTFGSGSYTKVCCTL